MNKFFYTFTLLLAMPAVHADGVIDDSLENLQLVMLKENTVKLSSLATGRCLNFLDSWQYAMRVAENEIVMRETFKGRLNAWVGGKVSSRDASLDGLVSQKENLQLYGETIAAEAARLHFLHQQCKQAEGGEQIYASAEELFDAIAEHAVPDPQRDPEADRLFGRENLASAEGLFTDRVIISLATVGAMPMQLHTGMPYQSPSILARYGTELMLCVLGSVATGAYMVLGGQPARQQVVGATTKVAQSAYSQMRGSAQSVYDLVQGKQQNAQAPTSWNPVTRVFQRVASLVNTWVQPKIELGKAAGITTVLGTVAYKSHSAAVNTFNNEILGVVNHLSLMLNKYDHPQRSELTQSDQGFLLLWTRQLRRYQELAPQTYSNMLGDILAALDDDRLTAGQKLSAINISLRRLR